MQNHFQYFVFFITKKNEKLKVFVILIFMISVLEKKVLFQRDIKRMTQTDITFANHQPPNQKRIK